MPQSWASVKEEMRRGRKKERARKNNIRDPDRKRRASNKSYRKWYKKYYTLEERKQLYDEYLEKKIKRYQEYLEKYPEYGKIKEKIKSTQNKRATRYKINTTNPNKGYELTLLVIASLPGKDEQIDENYNEKEVKLELRRQIKDLKYQDAKRLSKMARLRTEAEELEIPFEEYLEQLKQKERQKQIQEEKENKEKEAQENLKLFFSGDQLLINERLRELQKKVPIYQYDPDKEEKQKQFIKEEIKRQMSKISFDHGKTLYDLTVDRDFNIVLTKIAKMKTWNAVIDHFDPDTMMKTLDGMSASDKKLASNANTAQNRMLYLSRYLMNATEDLVL